MRVEDPHVVSRRGRACDSAAVFGCKI